MSAKAKQSQVQVEQEIRAISVQLEALGYRVRREKLKQGPGWKSVSGSCRVASDRLIFVDRKLAPEEQLFFLRSLVSQVQSSSPA